MNVAYPDQVAPAGHASWFPLLPTPYLYQGTIYTYVMGNVNNKVGGDFSIKDPMVVTGNATLYIGGNFTMSGSIYIAPGASLKIYVAGSTTSISGGGIINGNGNAANLSYYGLPGNTGISYAGGGDFIGTINAPEADFKLTGGASVYGAVIVNSYTSKSSKAGLHYDEALASLGLLKLVSYREL
jgi:hypothetical protein